MKGGVKNGVSVKGEKKPDAADIQTPPSTDMGDMGRWAEDI